MLQQYAGAFSFFLLEAVMEELSFPALYRSADSLSKKAQRHFLIVLGAHLLMLVVTACLSVVSWAHWSSAACQTVSLAIALGCSIYLAAVRPDRIWYAARAVAESIKTVTWRYVSHAEPFDKPDNEALVVFRQKLSAVVEQNREVAKKFEDFLGESQITTGMQSIRSSTFDQRKMAYIEHRIKDQLKWYAKKSKFNKKRSTQFFSVLISINAIAFLVAAVRMRYPSSAFWPTDILVAAAASVLAWIQAKRFSELASSYALASHEISLVKEQAQAIDNERGLSAFIGDAENAFSREHTQWVARKDQ